MTHLVFFLCACIVLIELSFHILCRLLAHHPSPRLYFSAQEQAQKANQNASNPNSPNLNKYDMYMQDYFFSNKATGPETAYHSFAMQLSSGQRVYGHVRRYYPHHLVAKGRIDVGRRGIRAMVLLTRAAGGENFYHSLLKTIETLASHRSAMPADLQIQSRPQEAFLHSVHEEHSRLSAAYVASKSTESGSRPSSASSSMLTFQALTVSMKQIELANNTFQHVDYSNFLLPQSLLLPHDPTQITMSPILPLLRCLGIAHTLRLFSALMCERRVVLVSQSTARLSACASAATSILAQGLLHWQHIYIPILPPSMLNYLAAPMPYLMGVTANHAPNIEHIQGLGEVLVIYLDQNDLKTHNMSRPDLAIPDILTQMEMDEQQYQQQQRFTSISEMLKMDLVNVMKTDRKLMQGDSGGGTAAVAGKGKDLLKRGFGKLKKVAKKQIERSRQANGGPAPDPPTGMEDEEVDDDSKQMYAYTEGFDNQIAEEEARIAFSTFFLCLIGDMKMYLRPPQSGSGGPPIFDKELFLESRVRAGESQISPMYPLLVQFKESQVFEMFVKARVAEIQARKPPPPNAALFRLALTYHNSNRIAFAAPEIRNTLRQISDQNPMKNMLQVTANVRQRAMSLTSNSRYEQSVASELSKLVQSCREGASILVEVMSVVWERIRDSGGMQWKHGYYALQMLLELILHGPLAAVAEATDGIDKIRKLKFYENMRSSVAHDMRTMATYVYKLLVDRTRLFSQRRVCGLKRMEGVSGTRRVQKKNMNLRIRMKFNVMHALVKPGNGAVSPAPPTADLLDDGGMNGYASASSGPVASAVPQHGSFGNDLLSMDFSAPPAPSYQNELVQMMGNAAIVLAPAYMQQPTIVQIPPSPLGRHAGAPAPSSPASYNYPPQQQQQQYAPQMHQVVQQAQMQQQQQPYQMQQQQQQPTMMAQQYQPQPNAVPQQSPTKQPQPNVRAQFDPFA